MENPSRRDVLKSAAGLAVGTGVGRIMPMNPRASFIDINRHPDLVRCFGPDFAEIKLTKLREGVWHGAGVSVQTTVGEQGVEASFASGGVTHIQFRWHGDLSAVRLYLGDHWERSYADLGWQGENANRTMPWYFLTYDGSRTHGYGVKTGAGALCFWNADSAGISLWADIRSGGVPVELRDRSLQVARIVCREGRDGESGIAALRAFCHQMCPSPRLPAKPVYGTNDWNYAFGNSSADLIATVGRIIADHAANQDNRPFSVIDEGWAMGPYEKRFGHGPWVGNPKFGDMAAFADRLKGMGIRPGLWFRPLTPLPDSPKSWLSQRSDRYLDPTVPDVHEHVASHMRRFVGWGYEMVKHDFTTWDMLGKWGFQMGPNPTDDGWKLYDSRKTNAEVLTDLYQTIRSAASSAYLIGCNTVGHLSAGSHELQRIGDDTASTWDRNRRMGVNTLAFRAAQHGRFFSIDPDIATFKRSVPVKLTEEWLELVAGSGAALFVAIEPAFFSPAHSPALRRALETASKPQPDTEPLDWLDTNCPRRWLLGGKEREFAWMGEEGGWPFGD